MYLLYWEVFLCSSVLWQKKTAQSTLNPLYTKCLQVILIGALICGYLSVNYFVVRELSIALFNLNPLANDALLFGWLFWIFTVAIPFMYVARGIQKKDPVLIRVGLLLVAAIIFTVRHYYFFAPIEVMMALGGIILILISYLITKYLKTPRYGFTNIEVDTADKTGELQVEALLQVQTLAGHSTVTEGTQFGGGSFGGGGASGEF